MPRRAREPGRRSSAPLHLTSPPAQGALPARPGQPPAAASSSRPRNATAPPVTDPTYAANARAFNDWLYGSWLASNNYPFHNVAVFDFYNILTAPDAHHRYGNGDIEHVVVPGRDTSAYPSAPGGADDHPNVAGSLKATSEFVPLLNIFYNRWKADDIPRTATYSSIGAQDGFILESAENSSVGGTANATSAAFKLGDSASDRQYRAILSFDTSALPDNAVVTRATLRINDRQRTLTISAGLSEVTHGDAAEDLLERAGKSLEAAQKAGGNCCFLASKAENPNSSA